MQKENQKTAMKNIKLYVKTRIFTTANLKYLYLCLTFMVFVVSTKPLTQFCVTGNSIK